MTDSRRQHRARLRTLNLGLQSAFLFVALMLVYWSVGRSDWLAARADNPRTVEALLRIQRGRITDVAGVTLAESVGDGRVRRVYREAAGAAVGYYSVRHGASGIEQAFDAHLRGADEPFWQRVWRTALHRPQVGRGVRLTVDADWQAAAEAALGPQPGALVLLSLPDRAVRALVSHPDYDPNRLDEQFAELMAAADAPLLNRAAQGLYQPGLALYPFVLGAMLDENRLRLDDDLTILMGDRPATAVTPIGDAALGCARPLSGANWTAALTAACPAPLQALAPLLTTDRMDQIATGFGLSAAVELPIAQAPPDRDPVRDTALALIGQENLTITPLQLARAWAALAQGGETGPLQLVAALQNESGQWQVQPTAGVTQRALTAESARRILAALPRHGSAIEYAAPALSGPGESANFWYLGLAPANEPRLALVLVLEGGSLEAAQSIGREVLTAVLTGATGDSTAP